MFHVVQNPFLKIGNRVQGVWHVLILLDVSYHLRRLQSFGKIDQFGGLDDGWYPVFDEGQVR